MATCVIPPSTFILLLIRLFASVLCAVLKINIFGGLDDLLARLIINTVQAVSRGCAPVN